MIVSECSEQLGSHTVKCLKGVDVLSFWPCWFLPVKCLKGVEVLSFWPSWHPPRRIEHRVDTDIAPIRCSIYFINAFVVRLASVLKNMTIMVADEPISHQEVPLRKNLQTVHFLFKCIDLLLLRCDPLLQRCDLLSHRAKPLLALLSESSNFQSYAEATTITDKLEGFIPLHLNAKFPR